MLHQPIHNLVRFWDSGDDGPADPDRAYQALADGAATLLDGGPVALYVIHPQTGSYRRVAATELADYPGGIPAAPRPTTPGSQAEGVRRLLSMTQPPKPVEAIDGEHSLFQVRDDRSQVVGLRFRETVYAFFLMSTRTVPSPRELDAAKSLVELAFITSQNQGARAALLANQIPIDITADSEVFYAAITNFLVSATGMKLVALRERGQPGTADERNLHCTALNGWKRPLSEFDIPDFRRITPFQRAIAEGRALFSPERKEPELEGFWQEFPLLDAVESFAVFPIKDEQRVFAVLSVAATCRVDFTPTFRSIVAGIARSVGVTLQNRELHFERAELQSTAIETAAALNAVELYSDLTHQMGNELTVVPEVAEIISSALSKGRSIPPEELMGREMLGAIEESHDKMSALLAQAEWVTNPRESDLEPTSIAAVWEEAKALVKYRAQKYDIGINRPRDYVLDLFSVQIRQVFFHLFLNSIAAFSTRARPRGGRTIELYVIPPKSRSEPLTLRYVDNAGGINPAKLRLRGRRDAANALLTVEEAIFIRGVTTRTGGTGNGLWVVRQILDRHNGSIALERHREGVVFKISIPTELRVQMSKGTVM